MPPIRVLLIEDDAGDANYLQEILCDETRPPIKVECAQRLSEALQKIADTEIDLILSDLSLPDSQGLETFSKVQQKAGSLPILVLTGLNDEKIALEAVRMGAQDYLVKGQVNGPLLAKTIRFAIERNRNRRELDVATHQLREANQKLERLAHNDPLTSMLNRRGLEQVLSHEVARANRMSSNIIALLIDLDDFKKINDTLGHSYGDGVLKEISARMQRPLRSTDYAARIGGDEFLILLPDTEPAEGVKIAEKVRLSVSQSPFVIAGQTIHVTASVGVVAVSQSFTTIDSILSETHDLLYQSKQKGKNRVSYDKKDLAAPATGSQTLVEKFRVENRFYVVMQPIFRLIDEQVVGYEFLSRASVQQYENPADFFRISLEADLASQMDQQCLSTCLEIARTFPPGIFRHINLSPATIMEVSAERLISMFQRENGKEKYCLEISQHQIVGDPSYLVGPLETLKKAGFLIAIEDVSFGTNSLESLVLLEPDIVKIDKQYVIGIGKDPARQRSLNRLLKMAESLGMNVAAEGIESQDDLGVLRATGVKLGQGFHWGKPSDKISEFARHLDQENLHVLKNTSSKS